MRKLSIHIFILILTFGLGVIIVTVLFYNQNSSKVIISTTDSHSNLTPVIQENSDSIDLQKNDYFHAPSIWKITSSSEYGTIVTVTGVGKTPNGIAPVILKLQCPIRENSPPPISFIVDNSEEIGFDVDDFEGPYAPAFEKKLGEIRIISPQGKTSIKTNVGGWYAVPSGFLFSPVVPEHIVRTIAKGSTEVTFVVHHNRDYQKIIEMSFPALDSSSDVAKALSGCRK